MLSQGWILETWLDMLVQLFQRGSVSLRGKSESIYSTGTARCLELLKERALVGKAEPGESWRAEPPAPALLLGPRHSH